MEGVTEREKILREGLEGLIPFQTPYFVDYINDILASADAVADAPPMTKEEVDDLIHGPVVTGQLDWERAGAPTGGRVISEELYNRLVILIGGATSLLDRMKQDPVLLLDALKELRTAPQAPVVRYGGAVELLNDAIKTIDNMAFPGVQTKRIREDIENVLATLTPEGNPA